MSFEKKCRLMKAKAEKRFGDEVQPIKNAENKGISETATISFI